MRLGNNVENKPESMKISAVLKGVSLQVAFFVVLGIFVFYYPEIGKIGKTVQKLHLADQALIDGVNNVFEIEEFQGKPYAFFSNPENRKPFLVSINDGKKILVPNALEGEQIFGVFNDGKAFFLATSTSSKKGVQGALYKTEDMANFERIHSSEGFGYRSFIKFKGKFVAGTDAGDGRLSISDDGISWHDTAPTNDVMPAQCNKMVVFKDKLYFASNSGVIVTGDLKSYKRALMPPQKDFQIFAAYATPARLYIGTGGANMAPGNHSHVYVSEEGDAFRHLATVANVPLLLSILAPEASTDEILLTGVSGKVFRMNGRSGRYSLFYDTSEYSVYISRAIGDSIFFGTSNGNIYRYGSYLFQ